MYNVEKVPHYFGIVRQNIEIVTHYFEKVTNVIDSIIF